MSSQVSIVARQVVDGRRAETLERLLEAGAEELRAVGHEALTVRTVAARAGVSPATAYTYVASKNHLFAELFWRYLDWRQRLKVLVDVDALPKTADQPVPQTLERVALDTAAKSASKLHDLWDAIMPLVPEEKRGANPFPAKDR